MVWSNPFCSVSYVNTSCLRLLHRQNGHFRVEVLSDTDWTGSHSYKRSTNRSYTFVGGNLVAWKSKKQTIVARSSTKAEYNAMTHTTSVLMWLQHFIQEIGFPALLLLLFSYLVMLKL